MKRIPCPLNGWRDAGEFQWGRDVMPAPAEDADLDAWAAYFYLRRNPPGVVAEWVCHLPSSYWFIIERDRASDTVVATYTPAQYFQGSGDGHGR